MILVFRKSVKLLVLLCVLLSASQTAWALKPDRVYQQTPDSLGLVYKAKVLTTADGYAINTWTIAPSAAADKHTTIVLAYQDFGNMSYFLNQANALSRAGYQVVTFDYRGFGHSADFSLNSSQLYYAEFAEDLRTVVRAARQQFPKQRLGVLSLSMGTIVAATVAAEGKLDFLVGEGFVTNLQALVSRVKQAKNKDVLLPAAASSYARVLPRVKCPLLVFAASKDTFTPAADSVQLVAQRPRTRELAQFEGGHLEGFYVLSGQPVTSETYGQLYVERISTFLNKAGRK